MKNAMIEAFELKRKGYYKQAIEIYYKLLSKVSDNVEILAELADLYYLLNNNDRALHYIAKSLEIKSDHIGSLKVLRKVYISENNYEKAENTAKKIYEITKSESDLVELIDIFEAQNKNEEIVKIAQNIQDDECRYKSALALYKLKRYDESINLLEQIADNPNIEVNDLESLFNLMAKIYNEQKNTEKAKEVYKKLENNNAQTAEGLNYIGMEKLDELKLDEAVSYFSQAVQQEEKNPNYIYNLGQTYFLNGWFEEAQNCFNTAICLNPMEEKYHYSLAYLYYKSGKYDLAESHLNPEYFDSKILLQVIKSEKGDLATPKVELEKMLNEHPKNEIILSSLAKIYYNLDMFKQAKTIIEQAIEVNPKVFEYQVFDIRLMLKLGILDEAETRITELVKKYPMYYYAHVLECELWLEKQDYDSLYDTAQELIELDINHYEGYYYNALALFEKEDINFAIESLKKAISLDVNNAELYVKMSEFYQAIGKYEDAFAYIKEASDIDNSAKNRELYIQLAGILRRKGISGEISS